MPQGRFLRTRCDFTMNIRFHAALLCMMAAPAFAAETAASVPDSDLAKPYGNLQCYGQSDAAAEEVTFNFSLQPGGGGYRLVVVGEYRVNAHVEEALGLRRVVGPEHVHPQASGTRAVDQRLVEVWLE